MDKSVTSVVIKVRFSLLSAFLILVRNILLLAHRCILDLLRYAFYLAGSSRAQG